MGRVESYTTQREQHLLKNDKAYKKVAIPVAIAHFLSPFTGFINTETGLKSTLGTFALNIAVFTSFYIRERRIEKKFKRT